MIKTNSFVISVLKSNLFLILLTVAAGGYFYLNSKDLKILNEFKINKIEFDGYDHVPDVLLLKASGIRYKSNIFSVSISNVKQKLEHLSWVKSASVQRKLPDKIYIRIAERVPIAIFQSKYKLYLLDIDGKILEDDGIGKFGNLPILVGDGAEKMARHFLTVLSQFPKIQRQLAFAVFVGRRRWNIKINKGITVKFPERNLSYAMKILDELADENGFFYEDIREIDLRMLDRVIIRKK